VKQILFLSVLLLVGCEEALVPINEGCTTANAWNYDTTAIIDDGSCISPQGCNDWCEGDSLSIQEIDCAGICGGTAYFDNCGACDDDSSNDCNYDCSSNKNECEGNSGVWDADNNKCWNGKGISFGDPDIAKEIGWSCHNPSTTHLYAGDNPLFINGQIPEGLFQLTNLTHLFLDNNGLTNIPDEINNLVNLKVLELENNNLSTLPESIGDLINLTKLKIGSNQLVSLPQGIGNLTSLKELTVGNNQISTIEDTIKNLTQLTYLSLGNNQINSISDNIGDLSNLAHLTIQDNQLKSIPASITNLTKLVACPPKVVPSVKLVVVQTERNREYDT